ncbi:PREDICTED: acyl-CoA Delta(11) desaturase [Wasmannia auropunctata]|uniref:acyl-CoA Delta(11) desaturase n=1 Tax=Wasmannia auropunctata TaxID=64793 RepID=UPI0005F05F01|nr:PREDICTED: acyl-CoA Delta(11) desaturase [Wasmannia auropunctata]XP_011698200.1 PREDICTED: acyl-CoA Delta(11) desaturase [Wasmannia auropunctata]XP_011698201.1 PREDICTED: acyl-CoA Delta(11) desaturase [Wasmannia auropunctata]
MAPNITSTPTGVLFEGETLESQVIGEQPKEKPKYVRRIVWRNVTIFSFLHLAALYGVYLSFTSAKLATILFAILMYQCSGLGITAGAHRLWAHRSYKAKWPLQLLLVILNTMAFQDAAIDWARDHRVHHKYSETDADPHNATRGFFFSHVGWLLCRKHPEVKEKGKAIDLSDLESDPILAFQKRYYIILMPLLCFILPTAIPVMCWNETWTNAYFIPTILRYIFTLNMTWLVNSAAHMFGNKPYDRFINPSENKGVAMFALGEGWHNYHHVFPWDYKTAEFGNYAFNFTTAFIDFFAKIGWAYDLKSVSENMVRKRVQRTGDGSHELWGWGDKDQTQEERDEAIVTHHHTKDQ